MSERVCLDAILLLVEQRDRARDIAARLEAELAAIKDNP